MLPYIFKRDERVMPGWLSNPFKKDEKRRLSDCLSLCGIENGWMVHKDGSLSVGFSMLGYEEDCLNEDGFISLIHEFATACKRLPMKTIIQKLDIYYDNLFDPITLPVDAPFFYKKSLYFYQNRNILVHQPYLFLRFFTPDMNPINTFYG